MATTRRGRLGRIAKLFASRGFGFIRGQGGVLAYFDGTALGGVSISALAVGMQVRFELDVSGLPRATFVTPGA